VLSTFQPPGCNVSAQRHYSLPTIKAETVRSPYRNSRWACTRWESQVFAMNLHRCCISQIRAFTVSNQHHTTIYSSTAWDVLVSHVLSRHKHYLMVQRLWTLLHSIQTMLKQQCINMLVVTSMWYCSSSHAYAVYCISMTAYMSRTSNRSSMICHSHYQFHQQDQCRHNNQHRSEQCKHSWLSCSQKEGFTMPQIPK
jgi:hypothetical protein